MPGVGCRWMPRPSSVSRAVAVRRGSTTIRPLASCAPERWPDERRHGGGHVRAQEENGGCRVEVAQREREASVDAERAVARGGRRGHAETAVVVDAARTEGEAGELAQLVRLLVGETATAEDGHRIGAVLGRGSRAGASAMRSRTASHSVSCSSPSAPRTSGAVRRSGERRSSAEVQPFLHRPPRFVGKVPTGDDHRGRALRRPIRPRQRHRALERAIRAVGVGGCRDPGGRMGHGCQIRNPSLRLRP